MNTRQKIRYTTSPVPQESSAGAYAGRAGSARTSKGKRANLRVNNDGNAADIVTELRDGGTFEWWVPSARQKGLPDGVYFFAGLVAFVEFKTPDGKLSPAQIAWRDSHVCVYRVLRSVDDARELKAAMLRTAEQMAGID